MPLEGVLTIDLTAAPQAAAWSLRDQHARPLAAPFPFCRGGRLEMPDVLLQNGEGRVLARARLARQSSVASDPDLHAFLGRPPHRAGIAPAPRCPVTID